MIFQVQFYKLDKFGWLCLGFSTEESAAYLLNRRLVRILPLRFGCESQVVMWPLLAQKQLNSFWWTALWGTRDNTNWFEPHYQPQKSIICHFCYSKEKKNNKKKACASHWHSQDILNDFRHQQHISVHPLVMWWLSELLRDFFFFFVFPSQKILVPVMLRSCLPFCCSILLPPSNLCFKINLSYWQPGLGKRSSDQAGRSTDTILSFLIFFSPVFWALGQPHKLSKFVLTLHKELRENVKARPNKGGSQSRLFSHKTFVYWVH